MGKGHPDTKINVEVAGWRRGAMPANPRTESQTEGKTNLHVLAEIFSLKNNVNIELAA